MMAHNLAICCLPAHHYSFPLSSLAATYPTEFVKTRAQFSVAAGAKPPGPIKIVRETVSQHGVRGLYSGCSALVAGNALKAGVRFLSYDSIKLAVADKEVRDYVGRRARAWTWPLTRSSSRPPRPANSPSPVQSSQASSLVSQKDSSP